MNPTRHQVLAGILVATLAIAALVLADVIWTVLFAATVAYVLIPVVNWLEDRGLSPTFSSVVATTGGTALLLGLVGMVGYLVYRRWDAALSFIGDLPESVSVPALGRTYVFETQAALETAARWLYAIVLDLVTGLPTLALKLTLFAFVVFGLLVGHRAVEDAIIAAIPGEYHDIAAAFAGRITDTLWAIYVLQVATGIGTFLIAIPVFLVLGYDIPITLAFISGVLQFVPIVGPSVLLAVLVAYQLIVGDIVAAVLIGVIGGVLIAWVPDIVIRPRLARRTGRLPGSLYFIGFVGGLLTVGPVGIIVGPLAVALVVEAVSLLEAAAENPSGAA